MTGPNPDVPSTPDQPASPPQAAAAGAADSGHAGAHDPWSRDADTVAVPANAATSTPPPAVSQPTANYPATGYPTDGPGGPVIEIDRTEAEPPVKHRRTPLVLVLSAVLLLVIGAGAYAGVRYYTGAGITEPESAVPASVTAFARIDLHPGLRDQLSVNDLLKKFPDNGKSTGDKVTQLERHVATSAKLDFDTDVKPWFGGQAGAAMWTNSAGKPVALLVFASKDDAKAKAALTKVRKTAGSTFGFVVRDGFAVVAGSSTDAQANAAAAASAAASHNLADSARYKAALSHISSHNLVIAYVDLAKVGNLLTHNLGSLGAIAGSAMTGGAMAGGMPGAIGGPLQLGGALGIAPPTGKSAMPGGFSPLAGAFASLKGTLIVGASVVGDGVVIRAHANGLPASTGAGTNVRPTVDAMSDATTIGIAGDGLDPNSATAQQLGQMLSSGRGGTGGNAAKMARPLTTLLTSKIISVSLTGLTGDMPSGFLAVDTRDAAGAQSLMSAINSLTGAKALLPGLTIKQTGTHVQATMGSAASTGQLGQVSLYTETTAGMSNENSMAYVDVAKLTGLAEANGAHIPADVKANLAPIKAAGFGTKVSGSSEDVLVRIVIK